MISKLEKLEKGMAKLTIEVPAEAVEKALDKAYQKNKNKINVPGFRKGKAPRSIIEKMYGAEIFYDVVGNKNTFFADGQLCTFSVLQRDYGIFKHNCAFARGELFKQVIFIFEIKIKCTLCNARKPHHIVNGGGMKAVVNKQLKGGVKYS